MTNKHLIKGFLLTALLIAGSAQAQEDRLSGTWRLSEPAASDAPPADLVMQFRSDGTFETRWAGTPASGRSTGSIVTTGHYRMTGPDSYEAEVEAAMACASSASCAPYPDRAPSMGIGTVVKIDARMNGRFEMTANGQRWLRQQE